MSRVWRKVKTDWEAWNARSPIEESIVRLILDGTVVRVRLDRKATSISLLAQRRAEPFVVPCVLIWDLFAYAKDLFIELT